MSRYLWSLAGLACLLLASGFMDSVDFFGMDFLTGFLGAFGSLLASVFCVWKAGALDI